MADVEDKLDDALQAYRNGLAIAKLLAEAGPSDNRWQSELIVLRAKMADVESAQVGLERVIELVLSH